jgi:hypothetical protein
MRRLGQGQKLPTPVGKGPYPLRHIFHILKARGTDGQKPVELKVHIHII